MNTLVVPLSHMTDKGLSIRAEVAAAELAGPENSGAPAGTVTVSGTLTEVGDEYLFRGSISGSFTQPCDRCLEAATYPFCIDVCWSYKEGPVAAPGADWQASEESGDEPEDETSAAYRFQGAAIDLRPQAWEEVALAMPPKILCRDECAGLCPTCGANLNHAPCRCGGEEKLENKGLAGLGNLFPELRPKNLEG